eukprot:693086-Lingulodinium_polyedra.AAC.1
MKTLHSENTSYPCKSRQIPSTQTNPDSSKPLRPKQFQTYHIKRKNRYIATCQRTVQQSHTSSNVLPFTFTS